MQPTGSANDPGSHHRQAPLPARAHHRAPVRGRGVVAVLAGHPAASLDDLSRMRLSFLPLRFPMKTFLLPISFAVLCAACGNHPSNETPAEVRADLSAAKAPPASPVVESNSALLQIVRTAGVQPATMQSY